MALAEYSDLFWYPSGALAPGILVRIFPHDSNVLAPLFTDATGTVPLPNPLTTSPTATISFWAESGLYWMHADSESFEIGVGLTPDDPDAIEELQAAVLQLQGEMNAVEGEVDTLQTDMNTAEADIDTLQSGLATANGEINALQADMTTAQADINALQADVGAVEGDITALETAMTTAQGEINTLQGEMTTAQSDINTLQADVTAVEGDVTTLQGEMTTAQSDINTLQADVTAVEGDVTALQGDMTTAQGDITGLQGDMTAAEADIAAAQADILQLQAQILETQQAAASTLSTGVAAGGEFSVNLLDPASLDIAPLVGYITSFDIDPFNPVITRIDYPGGTVAMDAGSLLRTATAWLMDADQNIIQQANPPTNEQRREMIYLGVTAQVAGVIIVDQTLQVILQQPANQLTDLMASLGAFNISGNLVTPNGVNLQINQSAGTMFSQSFNHFAGPVQTNDPHVSTTQAQTPASFRYITRNSPVFGPLVTVLDVANYDVAGVITPIGGGAGNSTIHRVWLYANNTATEQIVIQYGQTIHPNLAAALDAVGARTFVANPLTRAAALLGYICVTRVATNLSDVTQAVFVAAGKFPTP